MNDLFCRVQLILANRLDLFRLWVRKSTIVQGFAILIYRRPVVVAENMIGVAMYELVGLHSQQTTSSELTNSRSESVTIILLVK